MSTGELWTSLQQDNANNIRKWLYGSVLVRDWNPDGSTSLSSLAPFATDGNLITTLLTEGFPGGQFYDVGAIDEAGVDFTPKYKSVDTMIWQSRFPQRTDVDGDGEEVMFTCAESNPVVDCLFNNLPLSSLQSIGDSAYAVTYSTVPQIIYRQLLVIGVDGELADAEYIVEARPRTSIVNLDKRQYNAKKIDDFGLRFSCYVDPASGFIKRTFRGGPAWLASAATVTLPGSDSVVATATTTGSAKLVFNQPVSPSQPFTYTVSGDNTTTSTVAAATVGASSTINEVVELDLTGLTSSDHYTFTVTAAAANGQTATYPVSNSVTIA